MEVRTFGPRNLGMRLGRLSFVERDAESVAIEACRSLQVADAERDEHQTGAAHPGIVQDERPRSARVSQPLPEQISVRPEESEREERQRRQAAELERDGDRDRRSERGRQGEPGPRGA